MEQNNQLDYEFYIRETIDEIKKSYESAIRKLGLTEFELKIICETAIKELKEKGKI